MKKTIFFIIVLLALIGGVGYYGYTVILAPGSLSEQTIDNELADIDQGTQEIQIQGLSAETVTDIEGADTGTSQVAAVPATTADIDSIIAELNSFSTSDTSGYSTSLADL